MKKILGLIICGVLVLGVTGCGNDEKKELTSEEKFTQAISYLKDVTFYEYKIEKTFEKKQPYYKSITTDKVYVCRESEIVLVDPQEFKYTNDGTNYNISDKLKVSSDKIYYDYKNDLIYEYNVDCEKKWSYMSFNNNSEVNGEFIELIQSITTENIKSIDGNIYNIEVDYEDVKETLDEEFYDTYKGIIKITIEINQNSIDDLNGGVIDKIKIKTASIELTNHNNSSETINIKFNSYYDDFCGTIVNEVPSNAVNSKTCK